MNAIFSYFYYSCSNLLSLNLYLHCICTAPLRQCKIVQSAKEINLNGIEKLSDFSVVFLLLNCLKFPQKKNLNAELYFCDPCLSHYCNTSASIEWCVCLYWLSEHKIVYTVVDAIWNEIACVNETSCSFSARCETYMFTKAPRPSRETVKTWNVIVRKIKSCQILTYVLHTYDGWMHG